MRQRQQKLHELQVVVHIDRVGGDTFMLLKTILPQKYKKWLVTPQSSSTTLIKNVLLQWIFVEDFANFNKII